MDFPLQSPYCNNYKIPSQQKGLIIQHLIVRKLTRRELEDKYLRLIDENYDLKRENNVQKEKIKVLTTKILRLSKENSKYKSREFLFLDEDNEIQEAEEFFRPRRPVSSSAIPRNLTRNSTPNLTPKYKSDFYHQKNAFIEGKQSASNVSESMENSGVENNDGFESSIQLEDQINKLTGELKKLQDISELEKQTNAQLEIQVDELKEKLRGKKVQEDLEANLEVAELNKKIKELQLQLDEVEKRYQVKMEDCKKEQDKLNEMLEKERQKAQKFDSQSHEIESSKNMVETLMERIATAEKEKIELISRCEQFSVISDESLSYKKQLSDMTQTLKSNEKALEKAIADKASIEHSQEELLKKMKDLQKENDQLIVNIEGLKTENESLITKNKNLEDRIKTLEGQNKQHLQQINDTLKLPVPVSLSLDRESLRSKSFEESDRIQEIQEAALAVVEATAAAAIQAVSGSNTYTCLTSPTPSETSQFFEDFEMDEVIEDQQSP